MFNLEVLKQENWQLKNPIANAGLQIILAVITLVVLAFVARSLGVLSESDIAWLPAQARLDKMGNSKMWAYLAVALLGMQFVLQLPATYGAIKIALGAKKQKEAFLGYH